MPERQACKTIVELLALAHDRGCEAELAAELEHTLQKGELPQLAALRLRFSPDPARLPVITVTPVQLGSYEALINNAHALEAHA